MAELKAWRLMQRGQQAAPLRWPQKQLGTLIWCVMIAALKPFVNPMTFAECLAKFRVYLDLRGFSPETGKTYVQALGTYSEYLDAEGLEPLKVQPKHAHEYAKRMAERYAQQPWSLRLKIRSLMRLYGWLFDQGHVLANPTACLREPIIRRLPRNVLSENDVLRILELPDLTTPLGARDRAMMEVLYGSGLRASACLSATINDLDLDAMTIAAGKDKGGKPKLRPLTQPACEYLKIYILRVRPLLSALKPVPSTKLWLHSKGGPMSLTTLEIILRGYGRTLGMRLHPHAFRHAFATSLIRRGVDVRHVQELLGHVMPTSTQVYTHVAAVDTKKAVKESHPRSGEVEDLTPKLEGFRYRG